MFLSMTSASLPVYNYCCAANKTLGGNSNKLNFLAK